ncbi:MAG: hypothetical protein ACRECV_10600 [Xanthobacteraceae bacterium]
MAASHNANKVTGNADQPNHEATHEERLAAKLPIAETDQPDPMLQIGVGRVGAGSITLVGVIAAIILGVVLYGLNSPAPNAEAAATPPNAAAAPAAAGKPGPAAATGQQTGKTGHS